MKNKVNKLMPIIAVVLSLLLVIGVNTLFSACAPKDDGSWMHCHMVQVCSMCLGIVILVLSAAMLFVKAKTVGNILRALSLVLSVSVGVLPNCMSMCMMDNMRCHSVMKPFLLVLCVLLSLTFTLSFIPFNKKEKNGETV